MAVCEAGKAEGNRAVSAGDYAAAERHYTAALEALPADACSSSHLHATLLCNRAHARQQGGLWQGAVEDATAALDQLHALEQQPQPAGTDGAANLQKLRVKALYRRALCLEKLGELPAAFQDLNSALKLAPQNEGIVTAAERIKRDMPKDACQHGTPGPKPWKPEYPFCTRLVMDLVDSESFPGRIRGFTPVDSDAVVKFPCGMGVAVHHGHGGLSAIWPLGPPRLLPRVRERLSGKVERVKGPPELGEAFFEQPNMRPGDGLHFRYGRGGDLRWIFRYEGGTLEGLTLRFEPEGFLKYEACGLYSKGKLVERWQNSMMPAGYLGYALSEVAVPVKKALDIALSPCERRLCYENHVDVDGIAPARLCELPAGQAPEVPQQVSGTTTRPCEWWRSQLEVVDPSVVRKQEAPGQEHGFAPIGPADFAPEVRPILSDLPLPPCSNALEAAEEEGTGP